MTQKYLKNKRITSARAIYRILKRQKADFVALLRKQEKKSAFYEVKEDFIDKYLKDIENDLPDFLKSEVPSVMKKGAEKNIKKYAKILPEGYSLSFNLPTSPASTYVRDLVDLNLSYKEGSTLKTTRDELRRIVANGIDGGLSYSDVADQIEELDPLVFSQTRAKLISVNEIGRAYGWADAEPARVLSVDYVMEKLWETSNDEKVREEHQANEDEGWIPMEDAWWATGDMYAPSQDINCRCTSTDRIVAIKTAGWLIDVKGLALWEIVGVCKKINCDTCNSWV